MFSYPEDRLAAKVWFEDGTSLAADWEITGEAYGLAEWKITTRGMVTPGFAGKVRLDTVLGAFEGAVIWADSRRDAYGESSRLLGTGLLRYVGTSDFTPDLDESGGVPR